MKGPNVPLECVYPIIYRQAQLTSPRRMLGPNVLVTEGDVWKRHRRITAPAFNHATYKNVWDTTVRVYEQMLSAEGWSDANVRETPIIDFNKITHKVSWCTYHSEV